MPNDTVWIDDRRVIRRIVVLSCMKLVRSFEAFRVCVVDNKIPCEESYSSVVRNSEYLLTAWIR